jgi:hypothetical protein
MNSLDLGAHELIIPLIVDLEIFKMRSASGLDGYWATCIEGHPDFKRLRGVLLPEYIRVFVDIGIDKINNEKFAYVVCPGNQQMDQEQAALRISKILSGVQIFKDGKEIKIK